MIVALLLCAAAVTAQLALYWRADHFGSRCDGGEHCVAHRHEVSR